MKKSVKILALALAALMLCLSLTACAKKLSGTYEASVLGTGTVLEFNGSKVDVTFKIVGFESDPIECEYEIKDDKITITLVNDEDAEDSKIKDYINDFIGEAQSFEETDEGIKISGVEYTKKDK